MNKKELKKQIKKLSRNFSAMSELHRRAAALQYLRPEKSFAECKLWVERNFKD